MRDPPGQVKPDVDFSLRPLHLPLDITIIDDVNIYARPFSEVCDMKDQYTIGASKKGGEGTSWAAGETSKISVRKE